MEFSSFVARKWGHNYLTPPKNAARKGWEQLCTRSERGTRSSDRLLVHDVDRMFMAERGALNLSGRPRNRAIVEAE